LKLRDFLIYLCIGCEVGERSEKEETIQIINQALKEDSNQKVQERYLPFVPQHIETII